jgi:hypothetical protein
VVPARGETPVYLQGINLADGTEFSAEILADDGSLAKKASLKLGEPTTARSARSVSAQLETRGLKPGEYTLIATVSGGAGEAQQSTIRFMVE